MHSAAGSAAAVRNATTYQKHLPACGHDAIFASHDGQRNFLSILVSHANRSRPLLCPAWPYLWLYAWPWPYVCWWPPGACVGCRWPSSSVGKKRALLKSAASAPASSCAGAGAGSRGWRSCAWSIAVCGPGGTQAGRTQAHPLNTGTLDRPRTPAHAHAHARTARTHMVHSMCWMYVVRPAGPRCRALRGPLLFFLYHVQCVLNIGERPRQRSKLGQGPHGPRAPCAEQPLSERGRNIPARGNPRP